MAKLHPTPYTDLPSFDWQKESYFNSKQCKALEALFAAGKAIKFGVADGYACYYVKSLKPLVLQHIEQGGSYSISEPHLRGLRRADVEHMIDCEKRIRQRFPSTT